MQNDIIYWKGHVALALSQKKTHTCLWSNGKTVVMEINQTIERIRRTANLEVIGIKGYSKGSFSLPPLPLILIYSIPKLI